MRTNWLKRRRQTAGKQSMNEQPMNEQEFGNRLFAELRRLSGGYLPWPAHSGHERVQYLAYAGRWLCPEYVFKWPQIDWFENPAISEFYTVFPHERQGFNMDRRWNVLQFLRLIEGLPGDTAECGVFEGATSWLILRHAPDDPAGGRRRHHLFDSFEGCSQPGANDHPSHFHKGILACPEETVRTTLAPYAGQTRYYKGWIPSRFAAVADRSFAFVHIDVDLYDPTRDSIAFFYPRLERGAVLICDDYGCSTCPGATKAVDDFLADKPEKMLAFASGGGFMIKGTPTRTGDA